MNTELSPWRRIIFEKWTVD